MTFSNANNSTYNLQAQFRGTQYVKSDVSSWIKQQWAMMVRRELEQKLYMRQFVSMVTFPEGKKGDRVTIPTLNRLGVNTKQAGVPVTLQKNSPGSWQIIIDQYKEVSFMTEDIISIFLDPSGLLAQNLASEAAYAISRDLDAFLLGLRASINATPEFVVNSSSDGNMGASSVSAPFTLSALLKAKLILDKRDVPAEGRVVIVSPTQYVQLLSLDKVQSMFYRTSAPLESGIVGTLMGMPVYMTSMVSANSATGFMNGTTAIPTPGVTGAGQVYYPTQDTAVGLSTTWNTTANTTAASQAVETAMMFQSDAFRMAMMQEPTTEHSRETLYLADAVVTSTLYAARQYRPYNAVIINTNQVLPNV